MPLVNGTLTDFGLDPLTVNNPALIFRSSSTGIAGLNILSSRKAVEVTPAANGFFEVELIATAAIAPADAFYTVEIRYRDTATGMLVSEQLPWKLYVPSDGGALGDLLRVPANPGLVYTGAEPPELATAGLWWLDPATGDLAEYDGEGWAHKANLRGPAGVNSTDAAGDDAAIAAFIQGGAATKPALDAAYGPAAAQLRSTFTLADIPPALAAAGVSYPWDTARAVYNAKAANTRQLGYGLARAKGKKGLLKIALAGDSTTARYRANYATDDLADLIKAKGYTIAGELIAGNKGGPWIDLDPRASITGEWFPQAGNTLLESRAAGNTYTFTSTLPGTTVEAVVFGPGTATWTIDGAAQAPIAANAGALRKVTVNGLPNAVHTVTITTTSAGSLYLGWISVFQANGVIVANFGINSSSTYDWSLGDYYAPAQMVNYWAPDAVLLNLGINDFAAGWTTAAIKAQLNNSLAKYPNQTVFIETSNPTSDGEYAAINQAKYELANSRNIPLIDVGLRYGTYAQAVAAGYFTYPGDTIHPTEAGQAAKALHRADALGI